MFVALARATTKGEPAHHGGGGAHGEAGSTRCLHDHRVWRTHGDDLQWLIDHQAFKIGSWQYLDPCAWTRLADRRCDAAELAALDGHGDAGSGCTVGRGGGWREPGLAHGLQHTLAEVSGQIVRRSTPCALP